MTFLDAILAHIHKPLLIAALTFETTRFQRLLVFGVILLAEWRTYIILLHRELEGHRQGVLDFDYSQPSGAVAAVILSAELLLMNPDPRASIKMLLPLSKRSDKSTSSTRTSTRPLESGAAVALADKDISLVRRAYMATSLAFNPRYIGTNMQVKNVVPLSPSLAASRRDFCIHRFISGVTGALCLLGLYLVFDSIPFLKEGIISGHFTPLHRAISGPGAAYATYLIINSGHCLVSVVAVALRVSDPEEWPDYFGALFDAYTVGRAWGRTWHQSFRKPITSIGAWLTTTLRVPQRSLASRCIYLLVAFTLTTLVHVLGDFVLYNTSRLKDPALRGTSKFSPEALFSPQFFMSHAVAIMFEDVVIVLFNHVWAWARGAAVDSSGAYNKGGKEEEKEKSSNKTRTVYPPWLVILGKVIGYAWVYIWFCATLPQFARRILIVIHMYE